MGIDNQHYQDELSPAIELRETGRYTEAQKWLSRFIESDSNHPEALSLLSQVLLLDKKDAESEKVLSVAASINPELPSVYRNQARFLLKQSKPVEALEKAQSGCKILPEDPENLLVLAACLGANQRASEALPLIEKILEAKPNYAEAFANRALIRFRAKDIHGAITDAEMTVSLKPHLTQMWVLLSSLHYQDSNLSDAIEALRSAHKNEPKNTGFMIQLGEFLRQDNKASEAINILEQATELAPKDAKAWTNLGVAFQQEKRIADAKIAYEKALALNPKSAAIASNLGAIAKDAKEWKSALEYFGKALEIEPEFAEAHYNFSITLQELGRLDEAEASYTKVIALKPEYADAHSNLGNVLKELGRLDEAEASYTQAIVLKPDYAEAHSNFGVTLQELGRLDEAEASYAQAITLKPDYAEAHYNYGITLQELGRLDEAEASYTQAIALKPDYAEAHSNLGVTLQELGRLDEAEASYTQAIALKPEYSEAHNNLGITLQELGRLDEAEASYTQAIALKPEHALAHYNLGMCLFDAKRYDLALKEFESIDIRLSKSYAIKCSYLQDKESVFCEKLDSLINQGEANAVIGSLSCCSEIKYGTKRSNPFCNEPLHYVLKADLYQQYEFEEIFVKTVRDVLVDNSISHKAQGLLRNGIQTAGNIFAVKKISETKIESIIHAEVEKYRIHFKDSDEGFIRNWPTSYKIKGWLVSMRSGGELAAHMHELGWISGSVYINVPVKSETDSGNLVLRLGEQEHGLKTQNSQESIINVETGSMCLFPSSLHHYTVPFEDKENRIVLAFDVIPTK